MGPLHPVGFSLLKFAASVSRGRPQQVFSEFYRCPSATAAAPGRSSSSRATFLFTRSTFLPWSTTKAWAPSQSLVMRMPSWCFVLTEAAAHSQLLVVLAPGACRSWSAVPPTPLNFPNPLSSPRPLCQRAFPSQCPGGPSQRPGTCHAQIQSAAWLGWQAGMVPVFPSRSYAKMVLQESGLFAPAGSCILERASVHLTKTFAPPGEKASTTMSKRCNSVLGVARACRFFVVTGCWTLGPWNRGGCWGTGSWARITQRWPTMRHTAACTSPCSSKAVRSSRACRCLRSCQTQASCSPLPQGGKLFQRGVRPE
mmetsp:Transcript_30661/g.49194  ORF Transcript_30661/g.49194 Transcript_30661/m.49194 type:complete len:311 (+) Transcript_30661:481-1413(+)